MKLWKKILGVIVLILLVVLGWGVNYLFNYAIKAEKKDFISESVNPATSSNEVFKQWTFSKNAPQTVLQTSKDNLKLHATYFSQEQKDQETPKLAIVAHGYGGSSALMKEYTQMFYEMGYDVLLPDARGHGQSEGKYIGFGWPDRLDYVGWINQMVKKYNGNVEIVLYGVSMGGATVMMTAGEKLPENVKLIIEDCGYASVKSELSYQLKDMFHLPSFPLIPLTSIYTDLRVGYNFNEASSIKQLEKNKLPTLFIHGGKDTFVPTKDVYAVYNATKGPKELYIAKGAEHAKSYETNPEKYKKVVKEFIQKYLK